MLHTLGKKHAKQRRKNYFKKGRENMSEIVFQSFCCSLGENLNQSLLDTKTLYDLSYEQNSLTAIVVKNSKIKHVI